MSILEDILTKAVGTAVGGDGEGDTDKEKIIKALLPVLIGLLANGGLSKMLDKMKDLGLGDEADSWVGTGDNKKISGDDAAKILGDDQVKSIAEKVGLPQGKTADLIAEALPQVVDKASPGGDNPVEDMVEKVLKG